MLSGKLRSSISAGFEKTVEIVKMVRMKRHQNDCSGRLEDTTLTSIPIYTWRLEGRRAITRHGFRDVGLEITPASSQGGSRQACLIIGHAAIT